MNYDDLEYHIECAVTMIDRTDEQQDKVNHTPVNITSPFSGPSIALAYKPSLVTSARLQRNQSFFHVLRSTSPPHPVNCIRTSPVLFTTNILSNFHNCLTSYHATHTNTHRRLKQYDFLTSFDIVDTAEALSRRYTVAEVLIALCLWGSDVHPSLVLAIPKGIYEWGGADGRALLVIFLERLGYLPLSLDDSQDTEIGADMLEITGSMLVTESDLENAESEIWGSETPDSTLENSADDLSWILVDNNEKAERGPQAAEEKGNNS
ncbi:hypothetical protein BCR34DRAFT_598474 [Clohesyomyces aquaticus]|uniref:Uncharacterized protein n=1 Tax=Clohesyomyces aquaticus TaxID=1231657 RepID=A0A1Y1ZZ06_9PLEO|nr:hypothetical protein BCR34DRAFT_598474 [Clohesyomyces aquaticus]